MQDSIAVIDVHGAVSKRHVLLRAVADTGLREAFTAVALALVIGVAPIVFRMLRAR